MKIFAFFSILGNGDGCGNAEFGPEDSFCDGGRATVFNACDFGEYRFQINFFIKYVYRL